MLTRARSQLSYANVMATVAVFVAFGGTGYAVTQIDANSVGKKQLKKNAVVSKKVKNGSLLSADFKAGQLPAGADGAPGPPGSTGPAGADGSQGPAGSAGPAGADGLAGAQGPAGSAGPTGSTGPQGPTGPQGSPDTAAQVLNKIVTVDGTGSALDADLLDGFSSGSFARKIASSTLFIGYSPEAYDDPGECVSQFYTNIGGLELGDQVVASITRNGSEQSPPVGLLSSAWIVERDEGGVDVPRILVRFCNVTPGVIESVALNLRATVYR